MTAFEEGPQVMTQEELEQLLAEMATPPTPHRVRVMSPMERYRHNGRLEVTKLA